MQCNKDYYLTAQETERGKERAIENRASEFVAVDHFAVLEPPYYFRTHLPKQTKIQRVQEEVKDRIKSAH